MRFPPPKKVSDNKMKIAQETLKKYRRFNSHVLTNRNSIEIYDKVEVNSLIAKQESRSALKPLLESLLKDDSKLALSTATKKLMNNVSDLRLKFPNFEEVINRCEKSLALSMLNRPANITILPMLLVGSPGIGKTRFLTVLAETLQIDFYKCDLSSATSGFVLSGASTMWADGRPGMITDSLRKSRTAYFIFLLDEIDKVTGDSRYDPLGSLYSLLEKKTAEKFVDEALQVSMNCSAINWFASANYVEKIPAPILSRFNVYNISEPTHEQQCLIAQSVYNDLITDNIWGSRFEKVLDTEVVEKLVVLSARKQKSALLDACAEAAFRHRAKAKNRLKIIASDIQIIEKVSKNRTIGFH